VFEADLISPEAFLRKTRSPAVGAVMLPPS
jgi:hypothetical protein